MVINSLSTDIYKKVVCKNTAWYIIECETQSFSRIAKNDTKTISYLK